MAYAGRVGFTFPLTREEASLFFRLLVRRYERASLIVTSKKTFVDWSEVFNDQILIRHPRLRATTVKNRRLDGGTKGELSTQRL